MHTDFFRGVFVKKVNVELYNENGALIHDWKDVQSADTFGRNVKIIKKNDKGKIIVIPAHNITLIIAEVVSE